MYHGGYVKWPLRTGRLPARFTTCENAGSCLVADYGSAAERHLFVGASGPVDGKLDAYRTPVSRALWVRPRTRPSLIRPDSKILTTTQRSALADFNGVQLPARRVVVVAHQAITGPIRPLAVRMRLRRRANNERSRHGPHLLLSRGVLPKNGTESLPLCWAPVASPQV